MMLKRFHFLAEFMIKSTKIPGGKKKNTTKQKTKLALTTSKPVCNIKSIMFLIHYALHFLHFYFLRVTVLPSNSTDSNHQSPGKLISSHLSANEFILAC